MSSIKGRTVLDNKTEYTVKDYKAVKSQLIDLVTLMPKTMKSKLVQIPMHGFHLINDGITYINNEPVNPCETYAIKYIEQVPYDHMEELRKAFMDKGMPGVQAYAEKIYFLNINKAK